MYSPVSGVSIHGLIRRSLVLAVLGAGSAIGVSAAEVPIGYVYVNAEVNVNGYVVGSGGTLTAVPGSPYATVSCRSNCAPMSAIYESTRKVLYVSNPGDGTIAAFNVNQSNGALTAVPGSPFAVTAGACSFRPSGLAIDATKKYLIAGKGASGACGLDSFSIAANGALTPVAGSPFATGSDSGLTALVDPVENTVITSSNGANLSVLKIAGDGTLAPITDSPFARASNTLFLELHPTRRELALGDGALSAVLGFSILAGGGISNGTSSGGGPVIGVRFSPDGKRLYGVDSGFGTDANLYGFDVAPGPLFNPQTWGSVLAPRLAANVIFSTDGTLLFTNGTGSLRSYTLQLDGMPVASSTVTFPVGSLACGAGMVFVPLAPAINTITPPNGTTGGGKVITIGGTSLSAASKVTFDGVEGVIQSNSPTEISVTTPSHGRALVDVLVTTPGGDATALQSFTFALRGDVNNNGSVDPADIFFLINNLFNAGPEPLGDADANSSNAVDPADLFFLINNLFTGGPPPGP